MAQNEAKLGFERAMATVVGNWAGATDVVHGDRPDAVLTVEGRGVGVEIVSLLANDWAQAKSLMFGKLKPEIESALNSRGLNCLVHYEIEVPEHFPPGEELLEKGRRKARNDWRNTIAVKVADLALSAPIILNRQQLEERGITGLHRLAIQPQDDKPLALPGFRWSSPPPHTLAEELLRSKEVKLCGYRKQNPHLAEFWLAMGPFGPGTVENGYAWLMDGNYATDFEKVVLVNPSNPGQVWDVSPKPKK